MEKIGELVAVSPRDAWLHEERDFTPWLSGNLSVLGKTLGIRLELDDREVSVGGYFADIVAISPVDGSTVLIENQLEKADHGHLGQIMTYLAGTNAETVVWISTEFSDPHLSAIRWLNEHTVEPYSFFAVRLRVVRIGESPLAPIFEVLERPNNWERRIQTEQRERRAQSNRADDRIAFWTVILERAPDFAARGLVVNASSNQWLAPDKAPDLRVSIYLAVDGVGVFLRGLRGVTPAEILERFAPRQEIFKGLVGNEIYDASDTNHPGTFIRLNMVDRTNWEAAAGWLCTKAREWLTATTNTFGEVET